MQAQQHCWHPKSPCRRHISQAAVAATKELDTFMAQPCHQVSKRQALHKCSGGSSTTMWLPTDRLLPNARGV